MDATSWTYTDSSRIARDAGVRRPPGPHDSRRRKRLPIPHPQADADNSSKDTGERRARSGFIRNATGGGGRCRRAPGSSPSCRSRAARSIARAATSDATVHRQTVRRLLHAVVRCGRPLAGFGANAAFTQRGAAPGAAALHEFSHRLVHRGVFGDAFEMPQLVEAERQRDAHGAVELLGRAARPRVDDVIELAARSEARRARAPAQAAGLRVKGRRGLRRPTAARRTSRLAGRDCRIEAAASRDGETPAALSRGGARLFHRCTGVPTRWPSSSRMPFWKSRTASGACP